VTSKTSSAQSHIQKKSSKKSEPAGLSVRRLSVNVIMHVLKARQALDEAFESALASVSLDSRDTALAKAIAHVTFRYMGSLEHVVLSCCDEGIPAKAGPLRLILLTGAAQILHMDVADHAAVDLAVTLAREDNRSAPYHGLVNALLRRIAREKDDILVHLAPLNYDIPAWLKTSWIKTYGEENAQKLGAAHHQLAPLDLSVKSSPAVWAQKLSGIELSTGSVRLQERTTPIPELEGFEEGEWWIQDVGASLAAQLLHAQKGQRILDMCAAPGGKTAQLAAAGADVTALDRSEKRLKRLEENMARLKLNVKIVVGDASTYEDKPFDGVLLDAPCSATGTLRRHPEIAWIRTPEDIAKLSLTQSRLLDQAASLVKPQGQLVYCTCSLERAEGETQIKAFLKRHPSFKRSPISYHELGGMDGVITDLGEVRTLPFLSVKTQNKNENVGDNILVGNILIGMDGFFIARLIRG
jgi:16S rRNA (cytosine967-C5)-methyltransferase